MSRGYTVYILANRTRDLYIGVTGYLSRRMTQHREGLIPGFTTRYRIFRLVYFEQFGNVRAAIAREKEIKEWRRDKKIALIEGVNATWEDLARQFPHVYHAGQKQKQIPHPPKSGGIRDDR